MRPISRGLVVALVSVVVGGGCGGDDSPATDGGSMVRRGQLLVSTSDSRGVVRVGATAGQQSDVLLVDAETQKPIVGALAEAVEEDDDDGFLVRISKESAGYRPEVVRCRRGQPHTVPLGSSTADVRGRAVRVSARVQQDQFVGEFDLAGVNMVSERETRPEILFVPALDDPAKSMASTARYAVYLSVLPQTMFAVKQEGALASRPTVVRGQARVVSTSGARRGRATVKPSQVAAAGERHAGEELAAPALSALTVTAPGASGEGVLRWNVDDPMGRLIAFEVGIDTTLPQRRLAKDLRELSFSVRRGDHLACVRPVFAGADVDPVIRCLQFAAPQAPAAPSVRVSIKPMAPGTPVTARRGMPVAVEVSNDGEVDAPGFPLDVVVSRDGRLEGGLGQVRTLWIDGIKAGGRAVRTTDITPPRDGQLFVVARADGLRSLVETNAEDNIDRWPVKVDADGNRAPLVSVAGTAVGAAAAAIVEGDPIKLQASADDAEDGDLSAGIVWHSSRDGTIGQGPVLDTRTLSPGVHRLRAEVSDSGKLARLVNAAPVGRRQGRGREAVRQHRQEAVAESADAEMLIEVLSRNAPAGNSPPRLSAGPDLTTTVGGEVVPAATATDADGDGLTVSWVVTDEGGGTVATAGELRPRFMPPAAGLYRMTVTVSDGKASEKDELEVTVLPMSANHPPVLTVTLPPEGRTGVALAAVVMASDEDQDGLTLSYTLDRPQGSVALLLDGETRTPGFVPDVAGFYKLSVRADDGRGGVAASGAAVMVIESTTTGPDDAGPRQDAPADPDAGAGIDGAVVIRDGGDDFAGPRLDVVPAEVTGPLCDPLAKPTTCAAGQGCFVRAPGDLAECAPAGTLTEQSRCLGDYQCVPGLQCVSSLCQPICDRQRPTCPTSNVCIPLAGNDRFGICVLGTQPPPDGGADVAPVITCDPVLQQGCARSEDACHVRDGNFQCLLAGTGPEGLKCTQPSDCVRGTTCLGDGNGSFCRQYCDPKQPACPSGTPFCGVLPRSNYGVCIANTPPVTVDAGVDDSGTGAACDPVKQLGCTRAEDACFAHAGGQTACLLYGTGVPGQSPCVIDSDCGKGSGCFDGPAGRLCRAYCDVRNPACLQDSPFCAGLGGSQWGICLPQSATTDAAPLL